jgi:hypothetical protein
MAELIADLAYLLAILCNLGAFLLVLEWLVHLVPGAELNPIRRGLFRVSFPLLQLSDRYFAIKWGALNTRGLILAALFLIVGRYGVPCLVFFSFSLRG